jgi:N-dimethylarginine dimethylaminohydrolase
MTTTATAAREVPAPRTRSAQRLFLCPPAFYDVTYSINPWMDPTVPVDFSLAWRQWSRVVAELDGLGHELVFIEPKKGCPDMVFLGDAGIVVGDRFLCSRFRHVEREPEAEHYRRSFGAAGYEVVDLPPGAILEGLGDVSVYGSKGIFGHGPRSNRAGLEAFRAFAPFVDVIAEVELPDPRFYHLATALVFLDEDTVLFYPDALTPAGVRALEASVPRAIPVSTRDVLEHQACNCIVIGDVVLIDGCSPELERTLSRLGFSVKVFPASEFKKGGGSVRCLVLPALAPPQGEGGRR